MSTESKEPSFSAQVFALALREDGAISHFKNHLPVEVLKDEGTGYGEFYEALLDFHKQTGTNRVDKIAFKSWLEQETLIYDALGGKEGVNSFIKDAESIELSTPDAVSSILKIRHNRTQQRELTDRLGDLLADARLLDGSGSDEIAKIADNIRGLNNGINDPLKTVYDGVRIADDAEALWELPDFMKTPFPELNKALGYDPDSGFCKGAVHSILAASGLGKSTFAKTLMNYWVELGNTVLFVNYEEARAHWERVLFTQITKQNVYQGKDISDLDKRHYTQIFEETMRRWGDRFIVKHDPETPYFEDVEAWIRDIAYKGKKLDVIILDTIQSMFLKGSGKNLPRWGQYEEMMVRLEKLAKELHCVIVITAQENSNRMKEKREVVQQSDIGGSLAIAQKSSVALFLTRAKSSTGDDSQDDTIMQLQIPKNRITGVSFMMNPPLVRYNDDHKSYEDYVPVDQSNYSREISMSQLMNSDGGFH